MRLCKKNARGMPEPVTPETHGPSSEVEHGHLLRVHSMRTFPWSSRTSCCSRTSHSMNTSHPRRRDVPRIPRSARSLVPVRRLDLHPGFLSSQPESGLPSRLFSPKLPAERRPHNRPRRPRRTALSSAAVIHSGLRSCLWHSRVQQGRTEVFFAMNQPARNLRWPAFNRLRTSPESETNLPNRSTVPLGHHALDASGNELSCVPETA